MKNGKGGRPNRSAVKEKKKGKQISEKTAESQGIVAQGNSNPYNTALDS